MSWRDSRQRPDAGASQVASRSRVHILGAGGPVPTPSRFGSSFVLESDGELIMVDCGPAATHKLVMAGLWPTDVTHLLFTHHHFDHNADYACLLLTRWDQSVGGEATLRVHGPALTAHITDRLIGEDGAFAADWKARIKHPDSQRMHVERGGALPRRPPEVAVSEIGPGRVGAAAGWDITAATADHVQPYLDSLAYRFDSPAGSVVFTGDTRPCLSVAELARGADTMFCMCYDRQERMPLRSAGTGTLDAAAMAEEAGIKTLVLVHCGPRLASDGERQRGIDEVQGAYGGEVVFADELSVLDLA